MGNSGFTARSLQEGVESGVYTVNGTCGSARPQESLSICERRETDIGRTCRDGFGDLNSVDLGSKLRMVAGLVLLKPIVYRFVRKELLEVVLIFVEDVGDSVKHVALIVVVAPNRGCATVAGACRCTRLFR